MVFGESSVAQGEVLLYSHDGPLPNDDAKRRSYFEALADELIANHTPENPPILTVRMSTRFDLGAELPANVKSSSIASCIVVMQFQHLADGSVSLNCGCNTDELIERATTRDGAVANLAHCVVDELEQSCVDLMPTRTNEHAR